LSEIGSGYHAIKGNVATLKLTCFEFWDDYKAKKRSRRDTVTVTSLDRQRILMNGKSLHSAQEVRALRARSTTSPRPASNTSDNPANSRAGYFTTPFHGVRAEPAMGDSKYGL
jgi:hypothetical protein